MKFLNLKELNFKNDLSYIKVDPDENITDVTSFNYFTTHEFHKLSKKTNEKNKIFSILHSNICSLQGNFDKLQLLRDNLDYKFDVIAITETWHTENSVHFHPGLIDGYHKYEGNTGSSKKGGCGFYVKDTVAFANRSDLDIKHKSNKSEFETKWIEVIGDMDKNIIIGVVYRHPKSKDKDFYDYIGKTLKVNKKEKKKEILCGDFNLNFLNFERNEERNNFLNLLVSNCFNPQILGPTRVAENQRESLIDNIFLNFSDCYCISGNLFEKMSNNLANILIIEDLAVLTKKSQSKRKEI